MNKTVYAVIQQPGSGFLGLIGGNELHVKATASSIGAGKKILIARHGKNIRFKKGPVTTSSGRAPHWFKG